MEYVLMDYNTFYFSR